MGEQKKLYEVTVVFTYYAEAESPAAAAKHAQQAWDDGGADRVTPLEVTHSDHRLANCWLPESLVYGAPDDVELGDLLAQLPARRRLE